MDKRLIPKQLIFRFVKGQLLIALPLLAVAPIASRYFLTSLPQFLFFLSALLLIFIAASAWLGYRLIFPLGRVIAKTRAILRKDYSTTENPLLATEIVQGEWSDLESALNRIQSSMHSQESSLARDKEEMAAIISAISDAVIAVDKTGNVLFYNSQFAVWFGDSDLQKKQARLGELFRNPDVLGAFHEAIHDTTSVHINTQIVIRTETTARHFALSVAPIRKGAGDIYGVVGIFHDVTELKRTDQIRIDFVANVSHELRTPLTSIKGYTQTLRYDIADQNFEIAEKHIDIISRNVERLIAIVGDLLQLSSLESGGTDLIYSEVNLKDLTERVFSSLETKRAERKQTIHANFEVNYLEADTQRLEQVLYNLTENAIKYNPPESTIEIQWKKQAKEISLHVVDNGPGIAPEHHARLFERFYRVDSGRTREAGGTGLGLAIVKHIMQRHNGTIRVQSVLGKGAEFICTFPAQRK